MAVEPAKQAAGPAQVQSTLDLAAFIYLKFKFIE